MREFSGVISLNNRVKLSTISGELSTKIGQLSTIGLRNSNLSRMGVAHGYVNPQGNILLAFPPTTRGTVEWCGTPQACFTRLIETQEKTKHPPRGSQIGCITTHCRVLSSHVRGVNRKAASRDITPSFYENAKAGANVVVQSRSFILRWGIYHKYLLWENESGWAARDLEADSRCDVKKLDLPFPLWDTTFLNVDGMVLVQTKEKSSLYWYDQGDKVVHLTPEERNRWGVWSDGVWAVTSASGEREVVFYSDGNEVRDRRSLQSYELLDADRHEGNTVLLVRDEETAAEGQTCDVLVFPADGSENKFTSPRPAAVLRNTVFFVRRGWVSVFDAVNY